MMDPDALAPSAVSGPFASLWAARRPLALAAGAWLGATLARPVLPAVALAAMALVVVLRRWWRWCLLVAVLCSGLAARSLDGLDGVVERDVTATVAFVGDPEPTADGRIRVEVRLDGHRYLGHARAPAAVDALAPLLAGERARIAGRLEPFGRSSEWTRGRHLAGELTIERVEAIGSAAPHAGAANGYRRLLQSGATSLPEHHQALLAGLTLGDDRAQDPALAADFRAAGLTHLLAVSGQNVAFLLVVAGPLLRRLRLWPRFVLAVAVVAAFAFVTRFEPSVVRAAAVAVVALGARTLGRASGGVRHLAFAVAALLVVDPLLTRSLGFRLSVAACVGVLVLAPHVVERCPGPRWVADALGLTVGAQLAVAPVLVPVFGAMPLAALPANVVAAPIAGFLMVWGVAAGTAAGLLVGVADGRAAWLLHRPTALGLTALDAVASWGASLPLGRIDLRHVAVVALAALCWRVGRVGARAVAVGLLVLVVATAVSAPVRRGPVAAGWAATVWIDGPVAVVDLEPGASAVDVLDELRRHRVVGVGVVVVRSARPELVPVVEAIRSRVPVGAVLAPSGTGSVEIPGSLVPRPGDRWRVGSFAVDVERVTPVLRVRIGSVRSAPDQNAHEPPP